MGSPGEKRSGRSRRRLLAVLCAALTGAGACTDLPPPQLVTSTPSITPSRTPNLTEVVVGIDTLNRGFNPHTLADQSALTSTLGALLLPSVHRPGPDGSPVLDRTIASSAQVTKTEPFTVTYTLRRDASWSDGAPIAAEDFDYLWQQMRTAPGVVNAAGYRLISGVASRDSGKTVEVTFRKPYPGWRSLFTNLLPAHLLKDAPGGWLGAMDSSFPASGGPFTLKSVDVDRGEVVLERNDRYWDQPAVLDRIVLRKSDHNGLVSALRSGNDQMSLLRPDQIAMESLKELGKTVSLTTVPRPTVLQLLLRPASARLADSRVRAAVAAAIDRDALIGVGTGGGPSAQLRADAHVYAPSQRGYKATMPPGIPGSGKPDLTAVERLMVEAGYTQQAGAWMRNGQQLNLIIAAPAENEPYVMVAHQLQRQLAGASIPARVVTSVGDQLYGDMLSPAAPQPGVPVDSGVDIAVVPQVFGDDPATVLASNFGCWTENEGDGAVPAGRPNPASFCDRALQPVIDGALTGSMPLADALPGIEAALWQQAVSIPLFQLSDTLVTRPEVSGVTAGPPLAGPFVEAADWKRVPVPTSSTATPTPPPTK
ncbi:ABC transporter family substrate-binding protein [Allokutzneria albata]|uniref:ABC-type transport system, substrate-binding protein n=1 Tax=Allokutzneria albata TaxID=211114 RepID=A0A1G9YKG0_ALLAB|nr:ABC transporter family substrate-binding protein [Allokutzneria albata]SDN09614.1 ABC-type transport system, substrate-binding protein [Allokutzneria albata]